MPSAGVFHLLASLAFEDGRAVTVERRTFAGVGREAIEIDGPGRISASVVVPDAARLLFAVAGTEGESLAEVVLHDGSRSTSLWRDRVRVPSRWVPVSVDLGAHAGRTVTLSFVARGDHAVTWGSPVVCAPGGTRRNLLLYELDTLRADLLGSFGYPGGSSPTVDALARRGAQFVACYAAASWTRPSATSILTSLSAPAHSVIWEDSFLPSEIRTLAQILRDEGWFTVAFQPNPHAGRPAGLDRGFDLVFEISALIEYSREHADRWEGSTRWSSSSASGTTELIAFLLGDLLPAWRDLPLFLYVHPLDPHAPYDARPPFSRLPGVQREMQDPQLAELLSMYSRDVRAADHFLGRILQDLDSAGALERTVVAFLSDHGEEFGEHGGRGHGRNLYDETLRVPLVVCDPGGVGDARVVRRRASTLDVLPTVVELLKIAPPPGTEGRSLVPLLESASAGEEYSEEPVFAHLIAQRVRFRRANLSDSVVGDIAVLRGPWQCVVHEYGERRAKRPAELFDLRSDPGQTKDVSLDHPEIAAELAREAGDWFEVRRRDVRPEQAAPVDPELEEQLRALGYVR
jgi:arylsulfatase A-like enzyme